MTVKPIPDGHHTVTPYLIVEGVATLIDFMKLAFGAEELERRARPDGVVVHAAVKIGDSLVMMGAPLGDFEPMPASLRLYVEDTDATYERALRAGATSIMEPMDLFYGDREAGVRDPVGNIWWIATHQEDVSPEALQQGFEDLVQQMSQG